MDNSSTVMQTADKENDSSVNNDAIQDLCLGAVLLILLKHSGFFLLFCIVLTICTIVAFCQSHCPSFLQGSKDNFSCDIFIAIASVEFAAMAILYAIPSWMFSLLDRKVENECQNVTAFEEIMANIVIGILINIVMCLFITIFANHCTYSTQVLLVGQITTLIWFGHIVLHMFGISSFFRSNEKNQ